NQGKGFKPLKHRVNIKVGDVVMVGPGGSATVVYDDGCKVAVHPGAVISITPLSPCASGSQAEESWLCRPDQTRPDQTHDCGLTAGTGIFSAAWLGMVGFISYEISQANGAAATTRAKPASP
ncbi:MAG: hypothetical protein ACTHMB_11715, partial [Candidatus Binatia bacterium]